METPRTPKKRRNAQTRAIVASPYFRVSPGATSRHFSPERPCPDDQELPTFSSASKFAGQLPQSEDTPLSSDLRLLDDLCQQLALMKPPLIQGNTLIVSVPDIALMTYRTYCK